MHESALAKAICKDQRTDTARRTFERLRRIADWYAGEGRKKDSLCSVEQSHSSVLVYTVPV